jgi:2'-5' RNA ligase
VRAFFAVPSDGLWVESARALVQSLKVGLPRCSWTRPETWHLTLRFLGKIAEEAVRKFAAGIEPVAFGIVPGELIASGAVVLPPRGTPRVLGVGFAPGPVLEEISRLAAEAERQARGIGLEAEGRPFRPHVTLGRIREAWPIGAVEEFRRRVEAWTFPRWQARCCVLYESRLEANGAIHTPRAEWTFQGGPRGVRA